MLPYFHNLKVDVWSMNNKVFLHRSGCKLQIQFRWRFSQKTRLSNLWSLVFSLSDILTPLSLSPGSLLAIEGQRESSSLLEDLEGSLVFHFIRDNWVIHSYCSCAEARQEKARQVLRVCWRVGEVKGSPCCWGPRTEWALWVWVWLAGWLACWVGGSPEQFVTSE